MNIRITVCTKSSGPLTKRISLKRDGSLVSDGSVCFMVQGRGQRVDIAGVAEFAKLLGRLKPNQAITLGRLRPGLPEKVNIVTKARLNGKVAKNVIARTGSNIVYRPGEPALALFDYDTKGMPPDVATEMKRLGGFWPALLSVLPDLKDVARVVRSSTSSNLYRTDTGAAVPGSDGVHVYIVVRDGDDIERFLKALHVRCWLAGLGWLIVSKSGALLERSIVDRMVGAPERLVFEGAPPLKPPLRQKERRPTVVDGDALDTSTACAIVTAAEHSRFQELKDKRAFSLAKAVAKARAAFIKGQAARLVARTKMSLAEAKQVIARQCEGVLLPDVVLPFDDEAFANCTVGDVLADPERFEDATLADPIEGVEYGRCVAMIMRQADGTPWIHSYAHGKAFYKLKYDARAVEAALEKVADDAVLKTFVKLAMAADLDGGELEKLRVLVAKRSGAGKDTIKAMLKAAKEERTNREVEQLRLLAAAERRDPRPRIPVPAEDAPFLPQMAILNDVLGKSKARRPPMRDVGGVMTRVGKFGIPGLHAFTDANEEDGESTKLPPPEQWVLMRMNEMECAEAIEEYIDYVDEHGRSVQLPAKFVQHYLKRDDGVLPCVGAVSTLPLVLPDGNLLAPDGLDREHGIFFEIPKELRALIPRRKVTDRDVRKAMEFLLDEWLCDVAATFTDKCVALAAALTVIERSLIPARPVFFVSAGGARCGKTTLLMILITAVTGARPAAAAWSTVEEERRKSLFSYLVHGVATILWDNIKRGSRINCAHIEKACTTETYVDRKLGVTEAIATAASTIQFFTGNNITAKGELASRSLNIRLKVDRPDPENRGFRHPHPEQWTMDHRAEILSALYTVLLGNPMLKEPSDAACKTRFKMWWRLVGAAVEHGSRLMERDVDFTDLFLERDEEDEDAASLADVLTILKRRWPKKFEASDVAYLANNHFHPDGEVVRNFLFGEMPLRIEVTSVAVGKRLNQHLDEWVWDGEQQLVLRKMVGRANTGQYFVREKEHPAE